MDLSFCFTFLLAAFFSVGPPGALVLFFTVLLAALLIQRPSGRNLFVLRIYQHSLFGTTSGGDIFLCVKKDIEERHAKGLQSRPLDSGFLYGGSEGRRASVLRVRPGAINAI